jgi:hypothetical protein
MPRQVIASRRVGANTPGGRVLQAPPSVVITAPLAGATVTSPLTATWTFSSSAGRAHSASRAVLSDLSGAIVFDAGFTTLTSWTTTAILPQAATLLLTVTVTDSFGQTATSSVQVYTNALVPAVAVVNPKVGGIYEVGINGRGFMLADTPDTKHEHKVQLAGLQPQRFATSSTPFSEAIDRYTLVGFKDFSGGAGQTFLNRDSSVPTAFYQSEGVDVFSKAGEVRMLPASVLSSTNASTTGYVASGAGNLYWVDGTTTLRWYDSAYTIQSLVFGFALQSLTSDGNYWYAGSSVGVYSGILGGPPVWSSVADCKVLAWAGGRLCAGRPSAGLLTDRFTTIGPGGTEEVVGGRLTLPLGWQITAISGSGGFVYFTAMSATKGALYVWQTGSANAPAIAYEFPVGQRPVACLAYLGQVMVRCAVDLPANKSGAIIYRMPIEASGAVSAVRVVSIGLEGTAGVRGPGVFVAQDNLVLFSWPEMTAAGQPGFGAIDLSGGGYSTWIYAPPVTASNITDAVLHRGGIYFWVAGQGLVSSGGPTGLAYLDTGWLQTSVCDLNTSIPKVLDTLTSSVNQFTRAGQQVTIDVSYNSNLSTVSSGLPALSGQNSVTSNWGVQTQSFALKFNLNFTTVAESKPKFEGATVKLHPIGLADEIVVLPVLCADSQSDVAGRDIPENGLRAGTKAAVWLRSLMQTRVALQDVDWPHTGVVNLYEVVGVETSSVGKRVAKTNQHERTWIVTLTLRRSAV